ncbi:unnamed protein product [Chrysoparadoxa australica]
MRPFIMALGLGKLSLATGGGLCGRCALTSFQRCQTQLWMSSGSPGKRKRPRGAEDPTRGEAGFHTYYRDIYGERWPALSKALAMPTQQVARMNKFAASQDVTEHLGQGVDRIALDHLFDGAAPTCFSISRGQEVDEAGSNKKLPPSPVDEATGLTSYYLMDLASVVTAAALGVQPGDVVADFCAAPGGKTLILAEGLRPEAGGRLVSNDSSRKRRERLKRVVREYVPQEVLSHVKVTGFDASRWFFYEKGVYDRILVDAPCSSERHLLEEGHQEYLRDWSRQRSKRNAATQRSILSSALQAAKEGGLVLFSTCSINPKENDGVVAQMLRRGSAEVTLRATAQLHCLMTPLF